ncbi:DUF669 domain-containing protein [Mameliella alba]|uniref:DUF669 domain-containing protein n=1 Tax=Mameliella alba TaxID=561184 RepID=UPI000B535A09|nr:DUF669 domain-containing protein [Mameliella alba]OWV44225.1 hypothetical protein CDZ95_05945 [Mameliella alba]
MANLGGYDATGGETMREGGALEPGWYEAMLAKSERVDAKSGNGNAYVECEYEITDERANGRRVWSNLNLWNSNAQAVEIAQRELNSLMHACGKLRVDDTEELHGIPIMIKVGYEKGNKDRNRINGFKPLNSGGAVSQQQSGGAAQSKPWQRSA